MGGFRYFLILFLACIIPACAAPGDGLPVERVVVDDDDIFVPPPPADEELIQTRNFDLTTASGITRATGMQLVELATIPPAEVDGLVTQATDVAFRDNLLFAVYNFRGPTFKGALQVIDVSIPEAPVVVSVAKLSQSDVNRVQVRGDYIFVVGGDLELAATLDVFEYRDDVLSHVAEHDLLGYTGTMLNLEHNYRDPNEEIDILGTQVFVASGDNAGITVIDLVDPTDPAELDYLDVPDARYVAQLRDDELIIVAGGSPTTMTRQPRPDEAGWPAAIASYDLLGADVGAPTWGAVASADAFYVSADAAGVAAFSAGDDDIELAQMVDTTGDANGLALSPDRSLAFLANGQEGLVVLDVQTPGEAVQLAAFETNSFYGSANAIAVHHDLVALADGLGGVRLFSYELEKVGGRTATILATMSDPGIPVETAARLAKQTVDWVTPITPARILIVRDDNHHNESPGDTAFIHGLLADAGYDVTYIEEPGAGLVLADIENYDVVWLSNPGWPTDDAATLAALTDFAALGGGVVLQGDDISWGQNGADPSALTHLKYLNNGTKTCGRTTNNNNGEHYRVRFEGLPHPVTAGLLFTNFVYGDDIDHTRPINAGERVLAWAVLDGATDCDVEIPVVVVHEP